RLSGRVGGPRRHAARASAACTERDHLQPSRTAAPARTSRAMTAAPMRVPTIDDVRAAAERLRGRAVRTPLLESALLNEELGCRLLVKAECLQRTGSFKFRGAYNAISRLSDAAR